MIGLLKLPNGAWTVAHPRGPLWLLIRHSKIVRAELYDNETGHIVVWPNDVTITGQVAVNLREIVIAEGVVLAG
jgi:hypothetical protein